MRSRPAVAARLSYLAFFAAIGASFPYFGVFYQERGLDLGQIGLMTALGAAAGLVAAPVWGAMADRFAGSPFVISVAATVTAVGAVGLVLVDGIGPMIVALAILSVALAGIAPILDARALETVGSDRNRYGRIRAWGSAAFIVTVFVTGAVIERAGAPSMFVIYVAALLALAVVSIPLRGGRSSVTLPRLSGIGVVLRHRPIARLLPAVLLVWSAATSINWYFSIHLLTLGAPGELVGSAWAIGALVEIPILSAYPWLAARVGWSRLFLFGAAAFALRVIVLAMVTDPVAAAATMALHGVAFALVLVGGVTYVSRHAPEATAATAQGILSATVVSVAMIIGPGVGSWVAENFGVPALFGVGIAASVAGVPALWLAIRRDPLEAPAGGGEPTLAAPLEGSPSGSADAEAGR